MTEVPERAGWYDDPDDPELLRYFDGIVWSERRVPKKAPTRTPDPAPSVTPDPAVPAGAPAPTPWQPPSRDPRPQAVPAGAAPQPTAADGRPYAGFGLRLAAGLIDLLVVWGIGGLVSSWAWWLWMADYIGFAMDHAGDPQAVQDLRPEELVALFQWQWFGVAVLLVAVTAWLYGVLMLSRKGATVGKLSTGTVARPVGSRDVGPLPLALAIRRTTVVVVLWLLTCVPVLSWFATPALILCYLWAARDPRRQTWHDKIAGTEVVPR